MALGGSSMFTIALMRNPLSSRSSAGLPTGKATCQPWLLHVLPDKTQGLALKDLENWIFMHTGLGRRKKTLPAVSVTQTKALGSNRPQLLDLDLYFLSSDKAQAVPLCSRMKDWRPWCMGGYLYSRQLKGLHEIFLDSVHTTGLTYPAFFFNWGPRRVPITCLFYLLSVLQGPLFSILIA